MRIKNDDRYTIIHARDIIIDDEYDRRELLMHLTNKALTFEDIGIEFIVKPATLDNKMKLELLLNNIDKITLEQLENLIK